MQQNIKEQLEKYRENFNKARQYKIYSLKFNVIDDADIIKIFENGTSIKGTVEDLINNRKINNKLAKDDKRKYIRFPLKLNTSKDKELIDILDSQESIEEYLRMLVDSRDIDDAPVEITDDDLPF